MQAKSERSGFDVGEVIRLAIFQSLNQGRRKREGAAIDEFDDDPIDTLIITGGFRARLS